METKPTNEQAQLHLQVYDLRREARLRQARDWFQQNYFAETFDDAMRIAPMGTENGTFVGMVIGYWEQACALLKLLKPVVPEFRKRFGDPQMLSNLEKAAQRYEAWSERRSPGSIAAMRQLMQQERTKTATAAKA